MRPRPQDHRQIERQSGSKFGHVVQKSTVTAHAVARPVNENKALHRAHLQKSPPDRKLALGATRHQLKCAWRLAVEGFPEPRTAFEALSKQ
jgi:hypothetical protein